jgi:hypothetical protein
MVAPAVIALPVAGKPRSKRINPRRSILLVLSATLLVTAIASPAPFDLQSSGAALVHGVGSGGFVLPGIVFRLSAK